ncbi:MAG: helix-turn-helix domain-containing protein [Spirochaetia bacterium]|nr:helix-turn-helix domain-containing protein [Spirochaetia bacterium]
MILTTLGLVQLVTGTISLVCLAIVWSRIRLPGGTYIIGLLFAATFWGLAGAAELMAATKETKILWSTICDMGAFTVPAFAFLYVMQLSGRAELISRPIMIGLWIIPAVTIVLAWTNEHHGLIWSSFSEIDPVTNVMIFRTGTFHWVFLAYAYFLLAACVVVMIVNAIVYDGIYRKQSLMILAGFMLSWTGNILYHFNLTPWPGVDYTPMSFSVMGMVLFVGVTRLQMLDLTPVSRDRMFEYMEGTFALDARGRIIDHNRVASHLFGAYFRNPNDMRGDVIQTILPQFRTTLTNEHPDEVELDLPGIAPDMKRQFRIVTRTVPASRAHGPLTLLFIRENSIRPKKTPRAHPVGGNALRKYALDHSGAEDLLLKAQSLFENERVHLDEDLTLSRVAQSLGVEPYILSELINSKLRVTFPQLLNVYRVEEAIRLFKEHPDANTLDVAFKSGFNSKSRFNLVFKEITMMTPTEYRKSLDVRS